MSSECLENGQGEGGGFLKAGQITVRNRGHVKPPGWTGKEKLQEVTGVTPCRVCLTISLSYDLPTEEKYTKDVSFWK